MNDHAMTSLQYGDARDLLGRGVVFGIEIPRLNLKLRFYTHYQGGAIVYSATDMLVETNIAKRLNVALSVPFH